MKAMPSISPEFVAPSRVVDGGGLDYDPRFTTFVSTLERLAHCDHREPLEVATIMLGFLDIVVLVSYLALVIAIGVWAGRGQKTTEDYFLGGRRIPWWAAGLSIIATETSALTFIGAPTQSLRGDWTYLQLAIGSALARFVVAGVLIGAYYRADVMTVYGYLEQRFGAMTRNLASLLFFVGRSLGSGVRLYGAAIALVVVADIDFPLAIALIGFAAVGYTIVGGIKSVVWTDVVQGVVLVGGGGLALFFLLRDVGGIGEAFRQLSEVPPGRDHSKLRTFNFDLTLRESYTLWAGLIGSMFLTMATHGTDQDMIQRALTCRGEEGGKRSLILSALLAVPVAALFLAIGSLLWIQLGGDDGAAREAARIAERAGEPRPEKGFDHIFPFYVVTQLPAGVRGLIVAAIFSAAMSSLDSAIAALSATAVDCIWRPYVRPNRDEAYYLRVGRWAAVLFGVVLIVVAIIAWRSQSTGGASQGFGVLMLGLKVLTWIFPPLLGIFLLGVLTRRGSDVGNIVALVVGIGFLLVVESWGALFGGPPPFAWTWNAFFGCLVTFGLAAVFSGDDRPRLRVEQEG